MNWAVLRRRGWLVPLVAALTAAVAYGVATIVPERYTAEAVVVVPAGPSESTLGAVDQASGLAATYARLIPDDPRVVRRVADDVSMSADAVARRTSATGEKDAPILRLRFAGTSPRRAVEGVTALAQSVVGETPVTSAVTPDSIRLARVRSSVRRVRPRGARPERFIAEAVMVVSAAPASAATGDPSQAISLAKTYAILIAADNRVLARVARAVGASASAAKTRLAVSTDFETSLLRLRFKDDSADEAVAGARAAARAVAGATPVTPRIRPRSIQTVALPSEATRGANLARNAIPVGVIVGLALGVVLLMAFERADARVDDVRTLGEVAICPATSLADMPEAGAHALLDRWRQLSHSRPAHIVLAPATPGLVDAASGAAARLSYLAATQDESSDWSIESADALGGPGAGERLALSADVVVLVAAKGTKIAAVRSAVRLLEQFGAPPRWALLTPRRRRVGARPSRRPQPERDLIATRVGNGDRPRR